jgi:hypothetical protein
MSRTAAEKDLGTGQSSTQALPQRFICVADRSDVLERDSVRERVVPVVRSLLEVAGVPGEAVVVLRGQVARAGLRVGDAEPAVTEELDLLLPRQARFPCHRSTSVPKKKAPPM